MKPQYANITRVRRCPCCQSKKSKHNAGGSKYGNSAARKAARRMMLRDM